MPTRRQFLRRGALLVPAAFALPQIIVRATPAPRNANAYFRGKVATAPPPSGCDSVNDGSLAVYWPLDEASGNRTDSKNGNVLVPHGTGGVGNTTGIISNAATFVAANTQYLNIADNANVSVSGNFTIALWAKPTAATIAASFPVLFSKDDGSSREYVSYLNSGTLICSIFDSVSGEVDVTGPPLSADTWVFICIWYSTADNKARMSVNDGTTAVSPSALSNGPKDSTMEFRLGALGSNSLWWDGALDEFLLTKRVLTAGERTALYNSGAGCRPTGL